MILLLVAAYFVHVSQATCPHNFTSINGRCYLASKEQVDWQTAVEECSDLGGFLALSTTPDRRTAIHLFTHVSGMELYFWSPVILSDGESVSWNGPSEFASQSGGRLQWKHNMNETGPDDCVAMAVVGIRIEFYNIDCLEPLRYICETIPENETLSTFTDGDLDDVVTSSLPLYVTTIEECALLCMSSENCTGINLSPNGTECYLLTTVSASNSTANATVGHSVHIVSGCQVVTTVENGRVDGIQMPLVGSRFNYSCDPLFSKTEETDIICQPNGRWSRSPSCQSDIPCPYGWESHRGSCYSISLEPHTWEEAREKCQNSSGFLVEINDREEMTYLNLLLDYNRILWYWTGGNDLYREGFFSWWRDLYTPMEYTKWKLGQTVTTPAVLTNNNQFDCVSLQRTIDSVDEGQYFYMETDCEMKLPFICEKERINVGGYNCSLFEHDACSGPAVCISDKCVCPELNYIRVGEDDHPSTTCRDVLPVGSEGCGGRDDSCQNISICVGDRCVCPPGTYQNGQDQHYGTTCELNEPQCPPGWKTYLESCYRLATSHWTMEEAEANCVSKGGYLAKAETVEQNDFLILMGERETVWSGAHTRYGATMGLVWGDETPVTFTNWQIDVGIPEDNLCVSVNLLGVWGIQACDSKLPSICQIPHVCPPVFVNNSGNLASGLEDAWSRSVGKSHLVTCQTGYILGGLHTGYIECIHHNGVSSWGDIPECITVLEGSFTNLTTADQFARLLKVSSALSLEDCAVECYQEAGCGTIALRTGDDICWLLSSPGQLSSPGTTDLTTLLGFELRKREPTCPPVPYVSNAYAHATVRDIGSEVTYKCWPNYRLQDLGKGRIKCLDNLTWEEPSSCINRFSSETETTFSKLYTKFSKFYSVQSMRECQERCVNYTVARCKMLDYSDGICRLSSLGREEVDLGVVLSGEATLSVFLDPDLEEYQAYDGRTLPVVTNMSLSDVSLEICAQACLSETTFRCQSFDYTHTKVCHLFSQADPASLVPVISVQHFLRIDGCGEPILPDYVACAVLSSHNLSMGYEPGDLLKCHCTRFGEEIVDNHSQVIRCNPGGQWDKLPVCRNLCPAGWYMNNAECYSVISGPFTFWEAVDTCQSMKAAPVSFLDSSLFNFLNTVRLNLSVADGDYWTGLYRELGTWHWTDGTLVSLTTDLLNQLNPTSNTAMLIRLPGESITTAGLESQEAGVICKRAVPHLQCPSGWTYFNSSCYILNQTPDVVDNMATSCSLMGGFPASIHSQHQLNTLIYMRNAIQPSGVARVGLDKDPVTLWRWLDGSPLDFLYWQDLEATVIGVRQCATLGTYALIMEDCASPSMFFCQADLGEVSGYADVPCTSDVFCDDADLQCTYGENSAPSCRHTDCPAPWVYREGKCYYFSPDPATYIDAEGKCVSLGGHLTQIESLETENYITETVQRQGWVPQQVWIGLDKLGSRDEYLWVEGGVSPSYHHWAVGQPDTISTEHCATISSSHMTGAWYDKPCSSKLPFVCQRSPHQPQTVDMLRNEGCFKEENNKSAWDMLDTYYSATGLTIDTCSSYCSSQGYKYAAAMEGDLCKCGDMRGRYGRLPASACSTPCKGDNSKICGHTDAMSVYGVTEGRCSKNMVADPDTPGTCYVMSQHEDTWLNSRHQCQEMGGDLVTLSGPEHNTFVVENVLSKLRADGEVWIGLYQPRGVGLYPELPYTWINGSVSSWMYWDSLQPSDSHTNIYNKDCVAVLPGGRWVDRACTEKHFFMCQFTDTNVLLSGEPTVTEFLDFEYLSPENITEVVVEGVSGHGRRVSVAHPLSITSVYISCLHHQDLCHTDFTFMFWYNIPRVSGDMVVFSTGDCHSLTIGSGGLCMVYSSADSTIRLIDARVNSTLVLSTPIPTDTWNHLAIIRKPSSAELEIYLNGQVFGPWSVVPDRRLTPHLLQNRLQFGGSPGMITGIGEVHLDDVLYFNRHLLDTELSLILGEKYGATSNPSVFWWSFDLPLHYQGHSLLSGIGVKDIGIHLPSLGSKVILDHLTLSCINDFDTCVNGFSVSFWVKVIGSWPRIVLTTGASGTSQLTVFSSGYRLYILHTASLTTRRIDMPVTPASWYHLTLTWDAVSDILVYLDGELMGSVSEHLSGGSGVRLRSSQLSLGEGLCPLGWVSRGQSCYSLFSSVKSYTEAVSSCSEHNSHLMVGEEEAEWGVLAVLLQAESVFIGLHDADPGLQQEWWDVRGFPREGESVAGSTGDRCVVAEYNHTSQVSSLRAEPCSTPNPYICELEMLGRSDAALEKFRCPLGWLLRDKSCYHVTNVTQTHDQSQLDCASMGGELVQIETAEEQQAVSDIVYGGGSSPAFYHFGLRKISHNGQTMWVYWNRHRVDYTNWNSQEAEPGSSNSCAALNCDFGLCRWHSVPCDKKLAAVCEMPAESLCGPGWVRHGDMCLGVYYAPSVNSDVCVDVQTRPAQITSEAQAKQIALQLNLDSTPCITDGVLSGDTTLTWNTTQAAAPSPLFAFPLEGVGQCLGVSSTGSKRMDCATPTCILCEYGRDSSLFVDNLQFTDRPMNLSEVHELAINEAPSTISYYFSFDMGIDAGHLYGTRNETGNTSSVSLSLSGGVRVQASVLHTSYLSVISDGTPSPAAVLTLTPQDSCLRRIQDCRNGLTVSTWIYMNNSADLTLIDNRNGRNGFRVLLTKTSSEDLVIEFEVYETSYMWRVTSPFPLKQWMHVACVWHRFLGMNLYVNTVLMAELSSPQYQTPTELSMSEANSHIALVNSTDVVTIYLDELYIETRAWGRNRPLQEYDLIPKQQFIDFDAEEIWVDNTLGININTDVSNVRLWNSFFRNYLSITNTRGAAAAISVDQTLNCFYKIELCRGPLSVSLWLRPEDLESDQSFVRTFTLTSGQPVEGFRLSYSTIDDLYHFDVYREKSQYRCGFDLEAHLWSHVVALFDPSAPSISVHVNGHANGCITTLTTYLPQRLPGQSLTSQLEIGGAGQFDIDDVKMFDHIVDPATLYTMASCHQYGVAGFRGLRPLSVDPDMEGDRHTSHIVTCDLDTHPNAVLTIMEHNHPDPQEMVGTEQPGQYNISLSYGDLTEGDISQIKLTSDLCYQQARYRCKGAALFNRGVNQFAWWADIHGYRHDYWAGANDSSPYYCGCGMTDSCDLPGYLCNCDIDDPWMWRMDEGRFTDKTSLPVTQLYFGDTGDTAEQAEWWLGPLVCATPGINGYHFGFESVELSAPATPDLSVVYTGSGVYQLVKGVSSFGLELNNTVAEISGMTTPCYTLLKHCDFGFSVTAWLKMLKVAPQFVQVLRTVNSDQGELYGLGINCVHSAEITVSCEARAWYNLTQWTTTFNMYLGHWTHVSLSWRSDLTLTVYINGLDIATLGNVSVLEDIDYSQVNSTGGVLHVGTTWASHLVIDDLRLLDKHITEEDARRFFGSQQLCDVDWYLEESSGQCYGLSQSSQAFSDADSDCKAKGGHLAKAEGNVTMEWIKQSLNDYPSVNSVYLSLRQYPQLGHRYRWYDDSVTQTVTLSSATDRCAVLAREGTDWAWNTANCADQHHYLCQREPYDISPQRLVVDGLNDTAPAMPSQGAVNLTTGILNTAVSLSGAEVSWSLMDECAVNPIFCHSGFGVRFWLYLIPQPGVTGCALLEKRSSTKAGFSLSLQSGAEGELMTFTERLSNEVHTTSFYITTTSWTYVSVSRYPDQSVAVYLNGLLAQTNTSSVTVGFEFPTPPLGTVAEVRVGACLEDSVTLPVWVEDLMIVDHILNEAHVRQTVLLVLPDKLMPGETTSTLLLSGGVELDDGKFGYGLSFLSSPEQCASDGQFVQDCLGTSSSCEKGFTFSFWLYPELPTADHIVLSALNRDNGFAVYYIAASNHYSVIHRYGGMEHSYGISLPTTVWSHVLVTWSEPTGALLCVNGKHKEPVRSSSPITSPKQFIFPNKLQFGCRGDSQLSGDFKGKLDEFRFKRQNMIRSEVAQEYVKMMYAETAIELSFDEPLGSDVTPSLKQTEGVYESALEFDGLGAWLNLTDNLTSISCILGAPVCTSGLTLTFLFNFKGDHLEHDQYFITSPGEQGDGLGIYFRYTAQNKSLPFRRYFELGYRIESKEYSAWFNLVQDQWLQLFATWSDLFGLSVYIDGKLIATDVTGSPRGVQPFSQVPQLILGRRITDPRDTYGKFLIDHLELLDYGHPVGQSFLPLVNVHGWKHQVHRESVGYPYLAVQEEVTLDECRGLCESDGVANCDMFEFCPISDVGVCRRMARKTTAPPNSVISVSCDLFTSELISGTDLFIGCFESYPGNYSLSVLNSSTAVCREVCARQDYNYAGLEGRVCTCSEEIPGESPVSVLLCSVPCEDLSNQTCGGEGKMSLYSVTAARHFLNVTTPITDLFITYFPGTSMMENETLSLMINVTESGEAGFKVDFGDGSDIFYSQRTVWSHNYSQPGSYQVQITALNEISSLTAQQVIVVQEITTTFPPPTTTVLPLTDLSLSYTSPGLLSMPVDFILTFSNPSSMACFLWDFGDNTTWMFGPSTCQSPATVNGSSVVSLSKNVLSVNHLYSTTGQYDVSVMGKDSWYEAVAEIRVEVINSTCVPPSVSILALSQDTDSPVWWPQSHRLEILVSTQARCVPAQTLLYHWNLYNVRSQGTPLQALTLSGADKSVLVISPDSLAHGFYYTNVTVSYQNDGTMSDSSSGYFEITEDDLFVRPHGGQQRTVCDSSDLELGVEVYYGRSVTPMSDPSLTYAWSCLPVSTFCTELSSLTTAGNVQQVVVASDKLITGVVYSLTIQVTRNAITSQVRQTLTVKGCSDPSIHLRVAGNGLGTVSTELPFKMEACPACSSNTTGKSYNWTIYEVTPGGLKMVPIDSLQLTADTSGFILPGNSLEPGKMYQLEVSSGGTSSMVALTTGAPPYNGICYSNLFDGVAFAAEFTFTCVDWLSHSDNRPSVPRQTLTYRFAYKVRGSSVEPKTFLEISGFDVTTPGNRLRHGLPEFDWFVDITVTVVDYNSVSTTVTIPVQIYENPAGLEELVQTYLVSDCIPDQNTGCTLLVSNGLLDILNDKVTKEGFSATDGSSGSSAETGGTTGSEGSTGSGGSTGATGSGGSTSSGGSNNSGGSTGSGGSTSSGGSIGSGGSTGSGGSGGSTSGGSSLVQVLDDVVRILSENTNIVNTVSQLEMAVEAVTAIQKTLKYPGLLSQSAQQSTTEILRSLVTRAPSLLASADVSLSSEIGKALLTQSFQQVLTSRHDPKCDSTEIVVDNIPAWEVAAEKDKQRSELQQHCELLRQQAEVVNQLLTYRGDLVRLIMSGTVAGENAQFLAIRPPPGGHGISYQLERFKVWSLSNSVLSLNGRVALYLPDLSNQINQAIIENVDIELFEGANVFTTHESEGFVKTNITSASLFHQADTVIVKNLEEPVSVFLDTSKLNTALETHRVTSEKIGRFGYFYHRVVLNETGTTITLLINTSDPTCQYDLYLSESYLPSNDTYNISLRLPDSYPLTPVDAVLPADMVRDWRTQITRTFLSDNITFITSENSTWHLGIPLDKGFTSFEISMLSGGCAFWDERLLEWSLEGCKVGPRSWTTVLECQCTHLTTFGGNYFVPPNSIDFSTVFLKFQDLGNNAAVFSVVIVTSLLYIILLFILRRLDKKDMAKWTAVPLKDNMVWENYSYLLTVYTGMRSGAGTKSKVYFVLAGESGDTEIRALEGVEPKVLSRGSVTSFIMDVSESLGDISYLRIWHDNSGEAENADWFFKMMVVKDMQTGKSFYLLCDHWLAVNREDGQIERLIPVASKEELTAFRHLFYSTARHDLPDDHIWVSLFTRPTKSSFTRVQRLSCCMTLLFSTMIANAMWYQQGEQVNSAQAVHIGPLVFTMQELITSFLANLVILPVNILIVTIFRKARPKPVKISSKKGKNVNKMSQSVFTLNSLSSLSSGTDKIPVMHLSEETRSVTSPSPVEKQGAKKGCWLPHWCNYIGWGIVFVTIIVSGFFTILYSLEWGAKKAGKWLTAFLLSFVESILLIQPLKIVGVAIILSLLFKKPPEEDSALVDEDNVEASNRYGTKKPDHRRKYVEKPPNFPDLEKSREERRKRARMFSIFKESSTYVVYLIVLCILAYDTRDPNTYLITESVRTRLVEGKYGFNKIQDLRMFWNWSESVLVPTLFSPHWYNGEGKDEENQLLMGDGVHFRLGPPRLRQVRVTQEECKGFATRLTNMCYGPYGLTNYDDTNYSESWGPVGNLTDTGPIKSPWTYQDMLSLGGTPVAGDISTYSGGGYLADLGTTGGMASAAVAYLQQKNWLDRHSRAVFVEVNLYNPNANLFCLISLILELPHSSGTHPFKLIKTLRLYNYIGPKAIIRVIMEVTFAVFTLFYLVQLIQHIRKEGRQYFKSFWNTVNAINVVGALVAIGAYGAHTVFAKWKLSEFHENREKFVNLQQVALWDEVLTCLVGILLFFSMIRLIQMLRFNNKVNMFSGTLKQTVKPLLAFLIVFIIVFVSFAQFAYVVFGRVVWSYATFLSCLENQFTMVMMKFDFHEVAQVSMAMAVLYFFCFVLVVAFTLVNMLLSILNDTFSFVRQDTTCLADDPMMVDYIINQLLSYIHSNKKNTEHPGKQKLKTEDVTKEKPELTPIEKVGYLPEKF